ncbi:hypothetical protein F443_22914 [Phytophthora nicotianae P1569]|uniref:Uncharacterized protein n=1 Tax=Phytophthora nicotianae P1569 TaxID=1317065 RepID=V9DUH4_PHYNI|nr:hypothetical protein F443_22914 [Phytophthora nicotianae P1569]
MSVQTLQTQHLLAKTTSLVSYLSRPRRTKKVRDNVTRVTCTRIH